jgi:hypothetical protein
MPLKDLDKVVAAIAKLPKAVVESVMPKPRRDTTKPHDS